RVAYAARHRVQVVCDQSGALVVRHGQRHARSIPVGTAIAFLDDRRGGGDSGAAPRRYYQENRTANIDSHPLFLGHDYAGAVHPEIYVARTCAFVYFGSGQRGRSDEASRKSTLSYQRMSSSRKPDLKSAPIERTPPANISARKTQ